MAIRGGEAVVWQIDSREFDHVSGLMKYNATRKAAGDIKTVAQMPGYCPVQTGRLRREHKVVYLGGSEHAVIADTFYALWVHEGQRGRRANRWLNRATDAVHGRSSV